MEANRVVERFREFSKTVTSRLSGMPPSARLLLGSIAIIFMMGIFLVSQYAAGPRMTSLQVDSEFQAVAMQRIRDAGYEAETGADGEISVEQKNKLRIERLLSENEIPTGANVPSDQLDSSGGFKSDKMFSAELRQIRVAKAERIIRGIDGIVEAKVLLSETQRRGFGRDRTLPKATATIRLRNADIDRSLAQSVAVIAASVDADLQLPRVQVVDAGTGRTFSFNDGDTGTDGDYLADVRSIARDLKARVYGLLSMSYPSVRIEANAQVLQARSELEKWEVGKPQSAEVFERTEEESRPVASSGSSNRPGFASNSGTMGMNMPAGPMGKTPVATRDREERELRTGFPGSVERTQSNNGHPMQLDLAIVIPEDEFLATIAGGGDSSALDPETIEAEKKRQTNIIRELVAPLIDTTALRGGKLGTVELAVLPSAASLNVAGFSGGIQAPMEVVFGESGETIKTAGLLAVSLLTLAVMFMMVRKSIGVTSGQVVSEAELSGAAPVLDTEGAEILGEAEEGSPALVGVELDDEALRRKQMLEQLNQLVQNEPAEVAGLIRRWMRSET